MITIIYHYHNYKLILVTIVAVALLAVSCNLSANGFVSDPRVTMEPASQVGSADASSRWDVVLVGDVLYDADFAERVVKWLRHLHDRLETIV